MILCTQKWAEIAMIGIIAKKEVTGPGHHGQLYADPVVHNHSVTQGIGDCNKSIISHDSKEGTLCHPQKKSDGHLSITASIGNGRVVSYH